MLFAFIIFIGCLELGPLGLPVGIALALGWLYLKTHSSERDDSWTPPHIPSSARSDLGDIDFSSCEWEKDGDKFTNIETGVTFTRDLYNNWVADDDDGSGCYSEYYGWYDIED